MATKKRSSRGTGAAASGSADKGKPSKRRAKAKVGRLSQQAPEPARLQAQLRESIERDINERIGAHQRAVASLRANLRRGAPAPLMILAHGGSWFNYPLTGNGLPLGDTDIIAHLRSMGSPPPKVLNISHYGDATTVKWGSLSSSD